MSLNFAAISPHPPIIIPEIGSLEDLQKVSSTVLAMKKLSGIFKAAEIDTLIIISPHSLIYPDRFNICGMKKTFGTFAQFDQPDIIMEFNTDIDTALSIDTLSRENNINTVLYDNGAEFFELDHGLMVPLYFLRAQQESAFDIVPIAYSNLDRAQHFAFGQVVKDACEKSTSRIGILASGDLSHQLIQNPDGKKFDKQLIDDLKGNNVTDLLAYDETWLEEIGECGYRSILILLGALDGVENTPEILSYEGPFGVGYGVVNYNLGNK